jgi:hypothetical protein
MIQQDEIYLEPIEVTSEMRRTWKQLANWAIVMAIIGFLICLGMLFMCLVYVIGAIDMYKTYSRYSSDMQLLKLPIVIFGFILFIVTVMNFLSNIWHIQFATQIKSSISRNSQRNFELAWRSLRLHFRMVGIQFALFFSSIVVFILLYGSQISRYLPMD